MSRWSVVALGLCLLLAGCGTAPPAGSGGAAGPSGTATVTPVPVPDRATATSTVSPASAVGLRPTCERPPGRVVAIQVAALRAADREAGINTSWQFVSPASRRLFGSYAGFRDTLETSYGDLLNATTVEYGPVVVVGGEAQREVRLPSGETFRWVLERERGGRYDGCWMTRLLTRERDREAGGSQ